ncbi:MAG TPA: hypothetical protein VFS67_18635 [Polyangiaceae bacterium]|nr:hypothetical protein [Polyangiaceae bacterium]
MTYTFQRTSSHSTLAGVLCAAATSCLIFASACGDDASPSDGNTGGSSGSGGGGGSSGSGGSNSDAGVDAGSTDAGPSGPGGTITVLSSAPELRAPTTAAVRGNDLWVVNGQLSGLFGGPAPVLPFNVVSVPLTGGPIGSTSIALPGDTFYPEGIAAAADGTLYVGSVNTKVVVQVPADSTTPSVFVPEGVAERGVIGLTVDDTRNLLWFCDSNPAAAEPGAAIVGVSLDDGTEVVRHAMPNPGSTPAASAGDAGVDAGASDAGREAAAGPASFCNDLIVDGTGNLFATDSSGRIFRVPAASVLAPNSASVWLTGPAVAPAMPGGFGANGIDLVGGMIIIANGDGLWALNPNAADPAATARKLNLTLDGAPATLCGPDGLQAVPGSSTDLVVVENGGCNPPSGDGDRVVRIKLSF